MIEKATPPAGLVVACDAPPQRILKTTRDIVESRQDWITYFCECASKMGRLIEWNLGKIPAELPACLEISN